MFTLLKKKNQLMYTNFKLIKNANQIVFNYIILYIVINTLNSFILEIQCTCYIP